MKYISFLYQYIFHPKTVGAIIPSSSCLGDKMVEQINFDGADYIVEYGPGTGVFTEKLIKKRNPHTIIMLVESNSEFCSILEERFKLEKNLYIVNGSAENIGLYLMKYQIPYADYVISGLPFASLPEHVSFNILSETRKILNKEGKFITFQYTTFKKAFIEQFFDKIEVKKELRNVPPAFVFNCSKAVDKGGENGIEHSHCG
ncbi:MAG: class I SAM-dependent methyltransferase [Bacillota bacterium]